MYWLLFFPILKSEINKLFELLLEYVSDVYMFLSNVKYIIIIDDKNKMRKELRI